MADEADEFELSLDHLIAEPESLGTPDQILLYGPYKSGKTYLAASAALVPELSPVLYIDVERSTTGTVDQLVLPDGRPALGNTLDVIHVRTHEEIESLLKALTTKTHKYKTVVWDTVDVSHDRAVAWFEEHAWDSRNSYEKWDRVQKWLTGANGWLPKLKSAPFLSILVMHEREEKVATGAVITKIRMGGGSKDLIGGIPDIIGYTERKVSGTKAVSTISLESDDRKITGNRFHLPPTITNITMQSLYNAITEANKKEN
jgi:hypothetical protein